VTVRVGGKEHELTPGKSLDVPRRRIHVVRNAGQDDAQFLLEVRPARRMEVAMRALFRISGVVAPLARRRRTA
jgi:mannose-6-phosphate isomerase-like protein (cupin superfamily)